MKFFLKFLIITAFGILQLVQLSFANYSSIQNGMVWHSSQKKKPVEDENVAIPAEVEKSVDISALIDEEPTIVKKANELIDNIMKTWMSANEAVEDNEAAFTGLHFAKLLSAWNTSGHIIKLANKLFYNEMVD